MHKSRLFSIIIDCNDLDAGAEFWSKALGTRIHGRSQAMPNYVAIKSPVPNLTIWLQEVPEPKTAKSRVHLDFESDDVEAEVRRMESLGARRQQQVENWWIMEDPCGNEFCVLPIVSKTFADHAKTWDT